MDFFFLIFPKDYLSYKSFIFDRIFFKEFHGEKRGFFKIISKDYLGYKPGFVEDFFSMRPKREFCFSVP